jgi:hypothetical protein
MTDIGFAWDRKDNLHARFCEDVRYIRSVMPQPAEFCGALPRQLGKCDDK